MVRMRECVVGVLLATGLFGCQARQMVNHYASFDAVVTELYDKHVLYNLARRDAGRTMVQMEFRGFSANLSSSLSTSGKVQFFTNPDDEVKNGTSISLNAFRQAFEPNVSNSSSKGLAVNTGPAAEQAAIRALYEEQVNRPEQDRIYRRTNSVMVAMRSHCWVRTSLGEIYYVPVDKQREFSDFVHRVSFYKPEPVSASAKASEAQKGEAQASRK